MNPPLSPHHRSRRASTTSLFKIAVAVAVPAPVAVLPSGYALPTGGQVAAGNATIEQAGLRMTIDQTSRNAIVNWQSFNVGAGEQLRLNQTGADAAMLARVTGNDPSKLLGSLKADGKLFLINPKGILVGQGAAIDTSAFIATTLNVSDKEFLSGGAMTFKGDSAASVANYGQITAHEGNVMLFAHTVANAGSISAPKGGASLAAGTEVYLANPQDASVVVKFNLPQATAKTGVDNSGVIDAAQAELKAAGGSIYDLAINQSGIVRATGVENKNGRILLTADGGTVGVSGSASARNADGSGGEILVGGDYHGENSAVPNASRTVVTASATLDASATTTGAGGRVIVWSDEATHFLGNIDAHGIGGGFAEVSGKHALEFNPVSPVNVGADGMLVLDPDALVISASANDGTSTSGTDPFTFGAATEPANLNVTTLQNQLAASNVILDTSNSAGNITFNAPVTWATNNSLTAKAGGSIFINANLTGGASSQLVLNPGKAALPTTQGPPPISPKATLASSATITVGTLTYGSNPDAAPAGYTVNGQTGVADFQGNLNVGTLAIDLSHGSTGVDASGSDNAIGTLRTVGTGDLSFAQVIDHHGDLDVQLASANASAPQVRITTPGTLTLKTGTSLSFANPTNVILASTGDRFVNEAAASAIGANGRFLIYSSTLQATPKGGLTGIDIYSHPYSAADGFSGDSTSRFLYRFASGLPFLNYAADSKTRTYGAADPIFSATMTGLLQGVPDDVTGLPVFSTTATQSSGVGTYTINVGRGTLASSNYDFAFSSASLVVTAAPLTITANDASRHLNRPNPDFTASFSGLVNGDAESVVSGLTFSTTAVLASLASQYPITLSGGTAANYALTLVPGTLTVGGVSSLTIAANNANKTYGSANPTFSATMTGFEVGDDASIVTGLEFSTVATQSSGVGAYAISPYGASASGYQISFVPGTLTIDRAPLTIFPLNAARPYGDANPDFGFAATGLVNGDSSEVVSGLAFHTAATQASNAGSYALTVSGGMAANYAITTAGSATLTVNPAVVTVRVDDKTRHYGDADPALTYTVSGLKNSDPASLIEVSSLGSLATADAGIGDYGIFANAFSSSLNYTVNRVLGTLSITPRPLTITADNKTKVYGDPNPALTATFSGLAPFDTPSVIPNVQLSTTATQTSGVSALGYGILVNSGLNRNYAITYQFGSLSITPALLSLLAPPDVSRVYGRADPALPALNFGGLKNSDTIAGLRASYVNVPVPTADAGSYTYGVAINNPNYKLSGATTGLFRVDPAPLDVQIDGVGRLYGDANPASYSLTALGLAFGQTANSILKVGSIPDEHTPVGTYQLTAQSVSRNYYVNSTTGGLLQINPRVVSLTIDNVAKYYGDVLPDFHATVGGDGLASFDNETALFTAFRTATPVTNVSDVGLYRIDPVLTSNLNYRVRLSSGYLAILQRPIEVAVRNAVTFGNDQIPEGFDATSLGLDLITGFNLGGVGQGYSVVITGLPANTTVKEAFPALFYTLSDTNTPSPVGTAVTDLSTVFPTRPGLSDAVTPGTSLPLTLPPATVTLTPSRVSTPDIAPPLAPVTVKIGDRTEADAVSYIVPKLVNNNYVVTKITNGILTSKPDTTVLQTLKEVQAFKDIVAAANQAFYRTDETDKTKTGAFGFTADMFPFLRDLLLQMLETGYDAELWQEVFGAKADEYANDWANVSSFYREGYMSIWLSDLHDNPIKQAKMLPALVNFAMLAAAQPPEANSPDQKKVLEAVKPYLAAAEKDFATQLQQEKDAWQKKQASAEGVGNFMLGTDMFEEIMGNAMGNLSTSTMDAISGSIEEMAEKGAIIGGAGGVAGTAAGASAIKAITKLNPDGLDDLSALLKNFGGLDKNTENTITLRSQDIAYTPEGKAAIEAAGKKAADEFTYTLTAEENAKVKSQVGYYETRALSTDDEIIAGRLAQDKAIQEFWDSKEDVLRDAYKEAYKRVYEEASARMDAVEAQKLAHTAGLEGRAKATKELSDEASDVGLKAKVNTEKSLITKRYEQEFVDIAKQKAVKEAKYAAKKQLTDEMADELSEKMVKLLAEDPDASKTSSIRLANKASDELLQDADTIVKKATGEIAETGANTAEKAGLKVGTELLEKAGENAATKVGAKVAEQMLETASEKLGTKVAVKVGTTAVKVASWAKAAFFGPAALVELAVDLAVTAATNGIARGEEEKSLNKVIADCAAGKNSNDPHAMMQDGVGQDILMMAFVKMMTPTTTTTATKVASTATP